MSVCLEVAVIPHFFNLPKVMKPDSDSRFGLANVVVVACHGCESKRKMVRHDENDIALVHLMRESPIVFLVLGEAILS